MMPAKRYRRTLSINLAALGSALFMAFGLAACTMPNDAFQELSEEAEEGAKGKGGPGATGDGGPMAGGKKGGSPGAAGDGGASSPGGKGGSPGNKPGGGGSSQGGPMSCTSQSDCEAANACPKDAKLGCECAQTPKGDKACIPACDDNSDCPSPPDKTLTCDSKGLCVPDKK